MKTRLRQIHNEQPDLATLITQRWPLTKGLGSEWAPDEERAVQALVDEIDIEGPYLDVAELDRIGRLFATLDDTQQARVRQWVLEADQSPSGRPLSLGGGWHTTRRINLAEVCLLVAGNDVSDATVWVLTGSFFTDDVVAGPTFGAVLAAMNWREAQHLHAITRLHLGLGAEVVS